jgi:hypothetical protein
VVAVVDKIMPQQLELVELVVEVLVDVQVQVQIMQEQQEQPTLVVEVDLVLMEQQVVQEL